VFIFVFANQPPIMTDYDGKWPGTGRFATLRVMAIPNVKRFRPFCPTCNESFTVMAVLPKDTDVSKYLADTVARHDHKAFQEAKQLHFKIRVGQQKQKKAK
jgi:hypothetical protein